MKKIYLQPQMAVVKITTSTIIATSPNITINSNDEDRIEAADVESKDRGSWDIW